MFLRSFLTVSGLTLISRVFGFIREILISKFYGATVLTDMLIIAIRIPGVAREFFSTGISVASISHYGKLFEQHQGQQNQETQSNLHEYSFLIIFWTGIISITIVIIVEIFMPLIIYFLFPGFRDFPEIAEQIIMLSRFGFLYFFFLTMATIIAGILSIYRSYFANAVAPAISNILIITSLLVFSSKFTDSVFYLVVTFLIGGIFHLLFVIFEAWRRRVLPKIKKIKLSKDIKKTIISSFPIMMTTGVLQINIFISTALASTLPFGAISILFYTDRIIQLPIGLIGISLYTIMIPSLSRSKAKDNINKLKVNRKDQHSSSLQNQGISYALMFALPSCIGLYFLAQPIVYSIYVRGGFTAENGDLVVLLLKTLVLSLPFIIVLRPIIAFHHAGQKYSIPLQASIIAVSVHLIISLLLISYYQHLGIIIGLVVSAWSNTIYQWWRLPKNIRKTLLLFAGKTILKLLPALIFVGLASFYTNKYLINIEGIKQMLYLILIISFLMVVYLYYCFRISLFKKHNS